MTQYDVIVVGAGNAALAAAVSAKENGAARVVVLEKAARDMRGGNTYWSGAGLRFAFDEPRELLALLPGVKGDEEKFCAEIKPYPKDTYFADLIRTSNGRADPMLCRLLADNSRDTVFWMNQVGNIALERSEHHAREFGGLAGGKVRLSAPGIAVRVVDEGPGLSDSWFKTAESMGIEIRYGSAASELIVDSGGQVSGVKVRDETGYHTLSGNAVVLGCGGFEANVQMRTQHIDARIGQALVRGTPHNQGDGLRMALAIGAMSAGQWSGCHSSPVAADLGEFVPRSMGDRSGRHSYLFGVMINRKGLRFLDEGEASHTVTYAKYGRAILAEPGSFAYQVFDSKVTGLLEKKYSLGKFLTADTIEDLVAQMEIDNRSQAIETLRGFNSAARDVADGFDPTREDGLSTRGLSPNKTNWALRLDKPPFYAYPVTGGITFTFGGLKINEAAQVIGTDWRPMAGLYACGEMVGGLYYDNYAAAAGLVWGATSGRIAGRSAAKHSRGANHGG